MNVEIGTEAPIFLFWEYLFKIFGILFLQCRRFFFGICRLPFGACSVKRKCVKHKHMWPIFSFTKMKNISNLIRYTNNERNALKTVLRHSPFKGSDFYSDLETVLVFVVVVIMFILLTFYLSSFSTAWLLRYRSTA
jgi:hypothetical protein